MKNRLEEIIVRAKKALAVTDVGVLDMKADDMISVAGTLDSIILLAEDILKDPSLHEPLPDNMDHADHHNVAGSMNKPARDATYEEK